jgi:predicted MPP superfamily phosphohydrolase
MQRGEQHFRGVPLHISPGIGFSGPRLRIGVPPELTRVTFRRA